MAADNKRPVASAMMPNKQYINAGQDDQMEIQGYRHSPGRWAVTWVGVVLTAGLLRLFFYWLPHLLVKATHTACSLSEADVVILLDQYEQWFVSRVRLVTKDGQSVKKDDRGPDQYMTAGNNTPLKADKNCTVMRYFITKKVKYLWNSDKGQFIKIRGLEEDISCSFFHQVQGLTYEEQCLRRVLYGHNSIQIHVTRIVVLLFKEVLSPFYIFQLFSCSLWYADEYEYYASCIVFISCVSIMATIYQTRKMQRALRNTIESTTIVSVCRGGDVYADISSEDLVPGDVIELPRGGCIMQCDAVLVAGNCIVNESMLTGESVPVTKTPLPNPKLTSEESVVKFNIKDHARHILFCGTHVIQTRYYGGHKVKAVVFRTGFATAKGELVRSILYPKPVDFKFNRDTYKFIGILAGIALGGFIFTIVLMVLDGDEVKYIVLRSLDLITIAVPPALPAALTIGIVFAQNRLKSAKIYCISPRSINVCGSINTVCFDKTGTLTEDGLDMHGVVLAKSGKFDQDIQNMLLVPKGSFLVGMATCHSLTIIDGVLSGDPLELIMFEATGWELEEPGEEGSRFDTICPTVVRPKSGTLASSIDLMSGKQVTSEEVGIVRQFTFSSSLQRMSVIIKHLGAHNFEFLTKGAPEMVVSLCVPESVPDDFHEVLMGYTQHGYRVLAIAHKRLPGKLKYAKLQRIQREQVEKNLTFLGLLVMENRLKPETTPIISQLNAANIRTIMITGDNMLTALSVARECGMVHAADDIILVQAFPPETDRAGNIVQAPHVEYVYTDSSAGGVDSSQTKDIDNSFKLDMPTEPMRSFAVTGKSWAVLRKHFPELVDKIAFRGAVFARMSPDQKAQLVEVLQDIGYYVGMCGDGANDCGALKTAHAGISLSEAEASVASPFTSKTADISCVPTTIREGRAALVTSFGIFKYMACYSLIQFTSVLLLYWDSLNISDFQFLYIDLFVVTSLSITFGMTAAYEKLHVNFPLVSLFSLAPISSLVFQMCIMVAFQIFWFFRIEQEPWFEPWEENLDDEYDYLSHESTAIFYASIYQYLILALVFARGRPYRKSFLSNYFFLINLIICVGVTLWFNIYPTSGVESGDFMMVNSSNNSSSGMTIDPKQKTIDLDFVSLKPPPLVTYRFFFIASAAANLLLCLLLENVIMDSHFVTVTCQQYINSCFPGSKPKYESLGDELRREPGWPPARREVRGLAGAFQRMDSAYSAMSQVSVEGDLDSLLDSGSDGGSLSGSIRRKKQTPADGATTFYIRADDIKVKVDLADDQNGHTNMGYQYDNTNDRISTQL